VRGASGRITDAIMTPLLSDQEITEVLASLPAWEREGNEITATYKFPTYLAGIAFVQQVAEIAEQSNHHPDIHIGWRKVTLRVSTHSAGGLTQKDMALAKAANDCFARCS
jgi:4a-hydroxytetrahydrobiopterin dehydratase